MAKPRMDDVKNLILTATEALIERENLSEITLSEIAKEAKISKGTIYYYYKSKDEILFDITDKFFKNQWEDLILWSTNKEKDTSLPRAVMYILERAIKNSALRLHLIYNAMQGNEILQEKLLTRYKEFIELIASTMRGRTEFDGEYVAWLLLLLADGIIIQEQLNNSTFSPTDFIQKTVDIVRTHFSK